MQRAILRALLACAFAIGAGQFGAGARASDDVVFKIYNDTNLAITGIYNKDSRLSSWGWNDLQDPGASNPFEGKVTPIRPGHSFFIRLKQNSYAHCPDMTQDVKLVFANNAVKVLDKVPVCKVDAHINRP